MHFHWIQIILSKKYAKFFVLKEKEITQEKSALNPLAWSEARKTKLHPTRILPELVYAHLYLTPHPNWRV